MRIESMRYFVALAEAGSFYRAARTVPLSLQGLQKMLNSMEAELGRKLMDRSRQGLTLTADGEAFLATARVMTREYSKLLETFAEGGGAGGEGKWLISTTPIVMRMTSWLTYGISGLQERFKLTEMPFAELLEEVRKPGWGRIFFAMLNADAIEKLDERGSVVMKPVHRTRFGIVAQDGSHYASEGRVRLPELREIPLGLPRDSTYDYCLRSAFGGDPRLSVQVVAEDVKILSDFARLAPENAFLCDSLLFYLMKSYGGFDAAGLSFVPIESAQADALICQLYSQDYPPFEEVQAFIDDIKRTMYDRAPDYYARYPIADFFAANLSM